MISHRRTRLLLLASALAAGPTACALSDAAPGADEAVAAADLDAQTADPSAIAPALEPLLAVGARVDLNADGRADVCGRGAAGISCGLSTGTSFGAVTLWTSGFSDADGWSAGPWYYATIQFPDVNGDGRADVCGRGGNGIWCALSSGVGFTAPTLWSADYSDAGGWSAAPYYTTIQFPDVNGDGRADVCGRGAAGISCALSTGTGFTTAALWSAAFDDVTGWGTSPAYYGTIRFPDLDGDHRADVCGRGVAGVICARSTGASFGPVTVWASAFGDAGGWNAGPWYYATIQFADLDGDGRADVCGRGVVGISCGLSTGASFGAVTAWNTDFSDAGGWTRPQYYTTLQLADVNGEGRADVCGRGAGGIVCALSTGTSFLPSPAPQWNADFSDAAGWSAGPWYYATIRFPDVNGDGRADVCGRGIGGVVCSLSTASSFTPAVAPLWAGTYSDAGGWAAGPQYYGTIQFP